MKTLNDFFGFNKTPFTRQPDNDLFYEGVKFRNALDALNELSLGDKYLAVIAGKSGTGRSTLAMSFAKRLPEDVIAIYVKVSQFSLQQVLTLVLNAINIDTVEVLDKKGVNGLVELFNNCVQSYFDDNKKLIIIIDDADKLTPEVLSNIISLNSIKERMPNTLKMVFVTEKKRKEPLLDMFATVFDKSAYVQVDIPKLSDREIKEYINLTLNKSGGTKVDVRSSVVAKVARISGGNILLINTYMERAIISAYLESSLTVKDNHLANAISTVNIVGAPVNEPKSHRKIKPFMYVAVVVLLCVASYVVAGLYGYDYNKLMSMIKGDDKNDVVAVVDDVKEVVPPVEQVVVQPQDNTSNVVTEDTTPQQDVAEAEQVATQDATPTENTPVTIPDAIQVAPIDTTPDTTVDTTIDIADVEPIASISVNANGNLANVAVPVGTVVTVIPTTLNVRGEPAVSSIRLGAVYSGSNHVVLQDEGNWVRIDYEGSQGWLLKLYLGL